MDTVWISHPHLEGAVEVPASALAQHQRAGWEQTDPPLPKPPPSDPAPAPDPEHPDQTSKAPAEPGTSALPQEPPRRRRASTKEDT